MTCSSPLFRSPSHRPRVAPSRGLEGALPGGRFRAAGSLQLGFVHALLLSVLLPIPLLAPAVARAGQEVRVEVQLVVPPMQRLRVEQAVVSLPPVTTTDLRAGYLDLPSPIRLRLDSNCPWELSLRTAEEPAASSWAAARATPGSVSLLWSLGGSHFLPLTGPWTRVDGDVRALGRPVEVNLRIPLSWMAIPPGAYQPRIEYQLAPTGM
jgi:hypothetical protein